MLISGCLLVEQMAAYILLLWRRRGGLIGRMGASIVEIEGNVENYTEVDDASQWSLETT